jgi:GxxExxY protein
MELNSRAQTNADKAQARTEYLFSELTSRIIRAFYRVYDWLGFGFLESVYRNALAKALGDMGVTFEREVPVDVWFEGKQVGHFRADFLVDGKVLVEVKASQALVEADRKQLMNYLRGTRIELGLLLHFGPKPKIARIIYTNDRKPTGTDKHGELTD